MPEDGVHHRDNERSHMSKTVIVKKIASIAIMEAIMIAGMFLLLLFLKLFGIEGGIITRLVPFLSMLICTAVYYFVVDKGSRPELKSIDFPGIILLIVIALIPGFLDSSFRESIFQSPMDFRWLAYYLLVAIAEELFFRAYICYRLRELKKGYRILTSGVAFACIHFISSERMTPILFLLFALFGIVFALTYENLQNIVPLIGFHLVWNFMADYSENYSNMLVVISIWVLLLVASFLLKNIAKPGAITENST